MMGYGGGDLTAAGCPWPVIGPLRGACVQAVGGGLSGLAAQFSDESALEALYKSTSLLFYADINFAKKYFGILGVGNIASSHVKHCNITVTFFSGVGTKTTLRGRGEVTHWHPALISTNKGVIETLHLLAASSGSSSRLAV